MPNTKTVVSKYNFPLKGTKTVEKWLILGLGYEINRMRLEPENKAIQDYYGFVKRSDKLPLAKN